MKETGNLLREAREAKGITLQEVSLHLKINTKVLKSIEEGDLNTLPARTFLRGFVQSYGTYLKVDPNLLQEIFQKEMGIAHPGMIIKIEQPPPPPEPTKPKPQVKKMSSAPVEPVAPTLSVDPQMWSNYVKIGLVVFVLVIVALIVGVKRTIEKYEREAVIAESQSAPVEIVPTPIVDPSTPSEVTAPTDANQSMSETATITPTVTPTSNTITPPALSAPIVPAVGTPAKPPEVKAAATPPPATAATVEKPLAVAPPQPATEKEKIVESPVEKPAIAESPQEVIVEALDKVTVEYEIDGGAKTSIVLSAEKVHTFKAKGKISLVLSDGGSVNLIHNGKDKGVPGNLGQPLKISFPQ